MKKLINEQMKKDSIIKIQSKNFNDQDIILLVKYNSSIKQISLKWNQVSFEGIIQFSKVPWGKLQKLDLESNQLGDKGCKYLSKCQLSNLKDLNIGDNYISSIGIMHLSKGNRKQILVLSLNQNSIQQDGCKYLMKANFPKICILSIHNNKLPLQQVIRMLACSTNRLRKIVMDIQTREIDQNNVKLFAKKFPQVAVQYFLDDMF